AAFMVALLGCPEQKATPTNPRSTPSSVASAVPAKIAWHPVAMANHYELRAGWGSAKDGIYVLGNSKGILHSADGGKTWMNQDSRAIKGIDGAIWAIWGSSKDDVYVVGDTGILHSADGGKTWQLQRGGTSEGFIGVWGSSKDDVYVVNGDN